MFEKQICYAYSIILHYSASDFYSNVSASYTASKRILKVSC